MLDRHVGDMRRELDLDRPAPSASLRDVVTPALGLGFAIMAKLAPEPAH